MHINVVRRQLSVRHICRKRRMNPARKNEELYGTPTSSSHVAIVQALNCAWGLWRTWGTNKSAHNYRDGRP